MYKNRNKNIPKTGMKPETDEGDNFTTFPSSETPENKTKWSQNLHAISKYQKKATHLDSTPINK